MLAEEDDRRTLMHSAFTGAPLRTDEAGLLDVALRLPGEVFGSLVRTGKPLGPAALMRFPAERRNRFDRVDGLPAASCRSATPSTRARRPGPGSTAARLRRRADEQSGDEQGSDSRSPQRK
ncbi:hypothetical protein AB0A95_18615 [Micromonospora sp. NPDC049230]|uniref:hypothetical protein n=1 Tax=Micromonospora sp. NPDC049230 TaxID=3155502 RepID=UPI0033D677B1